MNITQEKQEPSGVSVNLTFNESVQHSTSDILPAEDYLFIRLCRRMTFKSDLTFSQLDFATQTL